MPTTTIHGLHYPPATGVTPDVPRDLQTLAEDLDPKLPSPGQKAALAGTSGTPGSGNKFVTDSDSRLAAPALVSTLPNTPSDKQEVYFQTSDMADQGAVWHLRYRSGSALSHKWEYLGGSPLSGQALASMDLISPGLPGFNDPTAAVAIPVSGIYLVQWAAQVQSATTGLVFTRARLQSSPNDATGSTTHDGTTGHVPHSAVERLTVSAAGTLSLNYWGSGQNMNIANRRLLVTPVAL